MNVVQRSAINFRAILFVLFSAAAIARGGELLAPGADVSARVDDATGDYSVTSAALGWTFAGSIGHPLLSPAVTSGTDRLGRYRQIAFSWKEGELPMSATIRVSGEHPVILFSDTIDGPSQAAPPPFPSFQQIPAGLHLFSYMQSHFAPPKFGASQCSTPWLLFDSGANAMVISPASHYMVASMLGDGQHQVASGFNPHLRDLPSGFTQQTILAFEHGINRTWDLWGKSLLTLEDAKRPAPDADVVDKYFGYWTDNFAYYYYHYDPALGYAGTLKALVDHYRQAHIPIRYLQLDSWWYYKSLRDADGKMGKPKNPNLPQGEWNRYGGLLLYKAHPDVFPQGLPAFQKAVDLPLITHDRWVDPGSPYHQKYTISGLAAVDPKFWDEIASYLKECGIVTYEQDWLDRIYNFSPEMSSNPKTGEEFLGGMAHACAERGVTMQYCMALPCYFLQGARYENLTSIRTSGDGFEPARYNDFLYAGRLAGALGIPAWSDVIHSPKTGDMLLATLSAGPVGIGDAIGAEDRENIFKVTRADGVIVKPDAPALPLDQSYIADAIGAKQALMAGTYTLHGDIRTAYLFAFNRSKTEALPASFKPAELGLAGPVCVYDYFAGTAQRIDAGKTVTVSLPPSATAYYIVAPFAKCGIAFLGDAGKFVSTGKQRVASLRDMAGGLSAKLVFAAGEDSAKIHGYSAGAPKVTLKGGKATAVEYDSATGHFQFEVRPDADTTPAEDSLHDVTMTLEADSPGK